MNSLKTHIHTFIYVYTYTYAFGIYSLFYGMEYGFYISYDGLKNMDQIPSGLAHQIG